MVGEAIEAASGVARKMSRTDPFLAAFVLGVLALVAYYIYNQQVLNDRIITIQSNAVLESHERNQAIDKLGATNEAVVAILAETKEANQKASSNLDNLLRVAREEREVTRQMRQQFLDQLRLSTTAALGTTAAVQDLEAQVEERGEQRKAEKQLLERLHQRLEDDAAKELPQ